MPQSSLSPPSRKRSETGCSSEGVTPEPPSSPGSSSRIFKAAPSDCRPPGSGVDETSPSADSSSEGAPFPPDGSPGVTEPFPEGLFRMPVPDRVFAEMPDMSDSALRSLLGLSRLSFRFDPEAAEWVRPDRRFPRAEVQEESGLSDQGTREGLAELEAAGYVSVDRSGRGYEYELEMEVPDARYTYVPTALLEAAPALEGAELRLVLAVLRDTWGWTAPHDDGDGAPEHIRWTYRSAADLAGLTGRSETTVKEAAARLEGRFLGRLRRSGGAYYYRFLPAAVRPDTSPTEGSPENSSEETSEPEGVRVEKKVDASVGVSLFRGIANKLAPDRQQTGSPYAGREFNLEKRAQHRARENAASGEETDPEAGRDAVPETPFPENRDAHRGAATSEKRGAPRSRSPRSGRESPEQKRSGDGRSDPTDTDSADVDLSEFSERLRDLGEILMNVGIWPRAVPDLLRRFSPERIRANFELYRKRAPGVDRPGAWLRRAITEGYALPSSNSSSSETSESGNVPDRPSGSDDDSSSGEKGRSADPRLPEPGTKVSETRKWELIWNGPAVRDDFDRFAAHDDPNELQHFYRHETR